MGPIDCSVVRAMISSMEMDAWSSASVKAGNDVLIGGVGNDQLYGDADPDASFLDDVARGADRFEFANGSDQDTILDFENGRDVIGLSGFAGIGGIGDINGHRSQIGADVVIDLGAAAGGAANFRHPDDRELHPGPAERRRLRFRLSRREWQRRRGAIVPGVRSR